MSLYLSHVIVECLLCGVLCPVVCVRMCVCVVRVRLPISHYDLSFCFSSQMIKLLSIYHVSNLDA